MLLKKSCGSIRELASDPFGAMLAAQMFAGAKFNRGPRRLRRYFHLKADAFDMLDAANKGHVRAVLEDRARKLKCSVSDLAWAIAPQRSAQGLHPVMVKRWEDIEKQEWQQKKAQG